MGKQKTKTLVRKAKQLYAAFPEKFGKDFVENKRSLDSLKLPFTKIDRNIIAGCLVKISQKEKI